MQNIQTQAEATINGLMQELKDADSAHASEKANLVKELSATQSRAKKLQSDLKSFMDNQNRSVREANDLVHATKDELAALRAEVVLREAEVSDFQRADHARSVEMENQRRRMEDYLANKNELEAQLQEEQDKSVRVGVCGWVCGRKGVPSEGNALTAPLSRCCSAVSPSRRGKGAGGGSAWPAACSERPSHGPHWRLGSAKAL